ncbi:MAG TPA: BatA domain-containing protein [Planctomicrobium sp.]|nr:BatA domain-containing protein [Planctomicrobium sp.]
MSFLAPLYLLATLAIGLPIAFHMIRRSPQAKQLFSSVMFLSPDPPRMTRRSRIEDWLLLLLRALAVCLLAFAFARPFLRAQENEQIPQTPGRQMAILLDISASMQRDDCWNQAQQALKKLASEITHNDTVALTIFDSDRQDILNFNEWTQLPLESRSAALLERAGQITPGWLPTQAGRALIHAAETLDDLDTPSGTKQVILISDMQSGAGWDVLNGFTWPENVTLRTIPVSPTDPSNATLQLAASDVSPEETVRIRVANSPDSISDTFQIGWRDPFSSSPASSPEIDPASRTISLSVPPGQSRIIQVPLEKSGTAKTLLLIGDQAEFDNTCHLVIDEVQQLRVVYLGPEEKQTGPNDPRFFLSALFSQTPSRKVDIIDWHTGPTPPETEEKSISWLLIGGEPDQTQTTWIHNWIANGGTALFVARNSNQAAALFDILRIPAMTVEEAEISNYAMMQQVDFTSPIFQQFNDPRFSDFTKIHFWKYRKLPSDALPNARTLASFDDGSPALIEMPMGKGTLHVLTSGWNRDDSNLALSSKFVPLMNGLLEQAAPVQNLRYQHTVGDEIPLSELGIDSHEIHLLQGDRQLKLPADGTFRFDRPGWFRFGGTEEELAKETAVQVAVNLPAEESRTDPLPLDLLTAHGVKLEQSAPSQTSSVELTPLQRRQLMNTELESRQQWWRWLVVAALLALVTESLLATRRRNAITALASTP